MGLPVRGAGNHAPCPSIRIHTYPPPRSLIGGSGGGSRDATNSEPIARNSWELLRESPNANASSGLD